MFRPPSSVSALVSWALVLFVSFVSLPSAAQSGDQPEYAARIQSERDSVDAVFADPEASILPDSSVAGFDGLDYFPVDPAYRVDASFSPSNDGRRRPLATTMGGTRPFQAAGTLSFSLNGEELTLTAYRPLVGENDSLLSVPFRDATSGEATYSAGRYIDLYTSDVQNGTVTLDFNRAYNPYCAYNPGYSCILPPESNHLDVPIRAGVKANSDIGKSYQPETAPAAEAPDESVIIASTDSMARVQFPGAPNEMQQNVNSPWGPIPLEMHMYQSNTGALLFGTSKLPGGLTDSLSSEEALAYFADTAISRRENPTNIRRESFEKDGYPAYRLQFEDAASIAFSVQYYLFGHRLYQTIVVEPASNASSAWGTEFTDSFELIADADEIAALPPVSTNVESVGPSGSSSAVPDSSATLAEMLNEIGWDFEVDPEGDYRVVLRVDDQRTQLAWITPLTKEGPGTPGGYEVFTAVSMQAENLSPDFMADMLEDNFLAYGAFEVFQQPNGSYLIYYSAYTTNTPTAEDLEQVVSDAVRRADAMEKKWIGGDEY